MGDVYVKCPSSGELLWYDWCSHEDYVMRYTQFDVGRFFWATS